MTVNDRPPKLVEHNNVVAVDVPAVPCTPDAQELPRQHPLWHCGHSRHYTSNGQVWSGHEPQRCMTRLYDPLKNALSVGL